MAFPDLLLQLQRQVSALTRQQQQVFSDPTGLSGDPAHSHAVAIVGNLQPIAGISGYGLAVWNGSSWVQVTGAGGGVTPGGAAGGDLAGTYPNPSIGNQRVTSAKVGSGAATVGQTLVADGIGGASWGAAASSGNKTFSFFMV